MYACINCRHRIDYVLFRVYRYLIEVDPLSIPNANIYEPGFFAFPLAAELATARRRVTKLDR